MSELNVPDAKLYIAASDGELTPFIPKNQFELQTTELGERVVAATNSDRIEFFKTILSLYPGPFFITFVAQETYGEIEQAGRYYSDRDKSRVQVDFFLDHFHDFISYDGFHHMWVSCQTTDGIVVYDQHDLFFVYKRAREAADLLRNQGFEETLPLTDFAHMHRSRPDILPGTKELMEYGRWWLRPLEIQDVARPERKSLQNLWLRVRNWRTLRRKKRDRKP